MATNTVESSHQQKDQVDYKQKYKTLKRKLRMLVYEQECFLEELRKAQRKLLKISRDRSFLLDRLLVYEKIDESSSDSEATATSESDGETQREGTAGKKKKGQQSNQPDPWFLGTMSNPALMSLQNLAQGMKAEPSKKKAKTTVKKSNKSPKLPASTKISLLPQQLQTVKGEPNMLPTVVKMEPGTIPTEGHMTREELERHLDSRQSSRPQYMSFVKASHVLPDDIFSHENSNPDGDLIERGIEVDDQDLIIDMPQ